TSLCERPTASAPLASLRNSSGDCFINVEDLRGRHRLYSLGFARLKAGGLLSVAQPFVKHDALLVIEKPSLKSRLLFAGVCIRRWLSLFQNGNESAITRGRKITDLAWVQKYHGLFNRGEIGRFVLRFFAIRFCFFFLDQRKRLELLMFCARLFNSLFQELS